MLTLSRYRTQVKHYTVLSPSCFLLEVKERDSWTKSRYIYVEHDIWRSRWHTTKPKKPYKDEALRIKECAADAQMSTQGYILQAVRKQMDADTASGVVKNPESAPLIEEKPSCSISPALKREIKKCIQGAVQNFSEKEYDRLRYEFDKLVFETFIKEARKPKKALLDNKKSEEPLKEDDEVNECHAESLL